MPYSDPVPFSPIDPRDSMVTMYVASDPENIGDDVYFLVTTRGRRRLLFFRSRRQTSFYLTYRLAIELWKVVDARGVGLHTYTIEVRDTKSRAWTLTFTISPGVFGYSHLVTLADVTLYFSLSRGRRSHVAAIPDGSAYDLLGAIGDAIKDIDDVMADD